MRIDGRWLWCDDGIMRPVISGEILAIDVQVCLWKSRQPVCMPSHFPHHSAPTVLPPLQPVWPNPPRLSRLRRCARYTPCRTWCAWPAVASASTGMPSAGPPAQTPAGALPSGGRHGRPHTRGALRWGAHGPPHGASPEAAWGASGGAARTRGQAPRQRALPGLASRSVPRHPPGLPRPCRLCAGHAGAPQAGAPVWPPWRGASPPGPHGRPRPSGAGRRAAGPPGQARGRVERRRDHTRLVQRTAQVGPPGPDRVAVGQPPTRPPAQAAAAARVPPGRRHPHHGRPGLAALPPTWFLARGPRRSAAIALGGDAARPAAPPPGVRPVLAARQAPAPARTADRPGPVVAKQGEPHGEAPSSSHLSAWLGLRQTAVSLCDSRTAARSPEAPGGFLLVGGVVGGRGERHPCAQASQPGISNAFSEDL